MLQDIRDNVARAGWHTQAVLSHDGTQPPFAYTIGLCPTLGHELIVIGLDGRAAHVIFHDIIKGYVPQHGALPLDTPMDNFANLPVMFKRCDPAKVTGDYVQQAFNYYDREDIPFVQMVICDAQGRFPHDPLFDHAYMDRRQPLLYPTLN